MRLLLDTHIWLWSLLAPQRLVRRVSRSLASPRNELWLSPISTWEVHLLAERGRLRLGTEPAVWIARALKASPMREAPITHEIALESRALDLPHPDPADRFLGATARVLGLTLVTADRRLLESGQFPVLANL